MTPASNTPSVPLSESELAAEQFRLNTTTRGFPAPALLPEKLEHEDQRFYVVRLSRWEAKHLRAGEGLWGKFALMANSDGTHELVRYAVARSVEGITTTDLAAVGTSTPAPMEGAISRHPVSDAIGLGPDCPSDCAGIVGGPGCDCAL